MLVDEYDNWNMVSGAPISLSRLFHQAFRKLAISMQFNKKSSANLSRTGEHKIAAEVN